MSLHKKNIEETYHLTFLSNYFHQKQQQKSINSQYLYVIITKDINALYNKKRFLKHPIRFRFLKPSPK